jgi:hypothetical protein
MSTSKFRFGCDDFREWKLPKIYRTPRNGAATLFLAASEYFVMHLTSNLAQTSPLYACLWVWSRPRTSLKGSFTLRLARLQSGEEIGCFNRRSRNSCYIFLQRTTICCSRGRGSFAAPRISPSLSRRPVGLRITVRDRYRRLSVRELYCHTKLSCKVLHLNWFIQVSPNLNVLTPTHQLSFHQLQGKYSPNHVHSI